MWKLWLILFFYSTFALSEDLLLQAIYGNWDNFQQSENSFKNESYSEIPNDSEGEHYSWELGTPDNIPETVIIYTDEPGPCEL